MKGLIYKCDRRKNYRGNNWVIYNMEDVLDNIEDEIQETLPCSSEMNIDNIIEDLQERTSNTLVEVRIYDTDNGLFKQYIWDIEKGKMKSAKNHNIKSSILYKLEFKYGIVDRTDFDAAPVLKTLEELNIPFQEVKKDEGYLIVELWPDIIRWEQRPDDFDYYEPIQESYFNLKKKLNSRIAYPYRLTTTEKKGLILSVKVI